VLRVTLGGGQGRGLGAIAPCPNIEPRLVTVVLFEIFYDKQSGFLSIKCYII